MIHPEHLPVLVEESYAVVPPAMQERLLGRQTRRTGHERLSVHQVGGPSFTVALRTGDPLMLVLDPADYFRLDLRRKVVLRGPGGHTPVREIRCMEPVLELQESLLRAWGLEAGQRVHLALGRILFQDVVVQAGTRCAARISRTDLLASRQVETPEARLIRQLPALAPPPAPSSAAFTLPGRLITENDVRQARLRHQKILVRPGQILTPAARSLGRELGVLVEPDETPT